MFSKFYQLILALCLLISSSALQADGFPLKNGRYAGGPVIQLKLTRAQTEMAQNHFESGMTIKLTKAQQSKVKAQGKLTVAPTEIMLFHAVDLANDCTCFAANWGFDFKPGWVEIPTEYLCSDEEAEGRRPDPNG